MVQTPIYMDNHATTRVDPRVVEAMLPFFDTVYGNAGSVTHTFGWQAKDAVDAARETIARAVGAQAREIVFTSGATESCNLAIQGAAAKLAEKGKHVIGVTTEHRAVLDPLRQLEKRGFEVTLLPVVQAPDPLAGLVRPGQLAEAIRDDTILVCVMLANNEIGALQPIEQIGRICRDRDVLFHCDATQAVGKIPVDVERLGVDLMSFSAHKLYGPKGIGALYVRRRGKRVRLEPLVYGGGHERGLRSGTLDTAGIVGFARAVELCLDEISEESPRLRGLRDRLFEGLHESLPDVELNGPALRPELRLAANLNVRFPLVDGEALIMAVKDLAVSSGSACSSADPEPSHVLRAIGLSEQAARSSIRIGLGRFNTTEEVDFAVDALTRAVRRLRKMSSLA